MPFISSAMECSPTDCPNCHFIIDYKYREGWCDYDGDGNQEYIREIYLSNFQVQNCPLTCWEGNLNIDAVYGKYAFAIYCLLKNHQWDTIQLLNDSTWKNETQSFWVWVRNHRCGNEKLIGTSKNFTFCYNNQCCTWKYRMRFDGWGNIPYNFNPWRNNLGNEWYAKKLDSLYCDVSFQCLDTPRCGFCYCNFSLDSIPLPFSPINSIDYLFKYHKNNYYYINIYNSSLTFILPNQEANNLNIEIYNIYGQIILKEPLEYNLNDKEYRISNVKINNGIYLYNIYSANKLLKYGKIMFYK